MCMFVLIMSKSRAKSRGRTITSPSQVSPSKSPVRQMPPLFDSPGGASPPKYPLSKIQPFYDSPSQAAASASTTSSSLTRKRITGNHEDPKYTRAPKKNEVIFNGGKALHTIAIVKAIDDWLDILKDSGNEEEINKTLLLRKEYVENGPETLEEWEKRSQEKERRKSYCETNGCTVSLRL